MHHVFQFQVLEVVSTLTTSLVGQSSFGLIHLMEESGLDNEEICRLEKISIQSLVSETWIVYHDNNCLCAPATAEILAL